MFFESPHRVGDALADLATAFGPDRRAALCRELTKLHEEVARGSLAELAERFADGTRGELVLVVAGAAPGGVSIEDAVPDVLSLVAAGARLRDAAGEVAASTGLSRRDLYEAALRAKT